MHALSSVPQRLILLCLCLFMAITSAHAENNWPQFRGEDSRGVVENANLPTEWSATKNVEWKTDIPGRGWSSPIVWGNKVFLTTVLTDGEFIEARKGLYWIDELPQPSKETHHWMVYCLDLESGNILWEKEVHKGKPTSPHHLKNSLASETPVTDGERVYCFFGNLGLYTFDMDGELQWTQAVAPHKMSWNWGTAASPMLHGDRVYIINDNEEDSYLLALDKKTGDEIWRIKREEEKSNWSTPYIWEHDGITEIVTSGTVKVRSYDLDGKLLWSLKGMSEITIATPYAYDGLLYLSSGYVGDKTWRPIYAVRPGAKGDITLAEGETSNEFIAWFHKVGAPYNPSTIVYEDRLFVLHDKKKMDCYNSKTGELIYEKAPFPKGTAGFTSSPWAYGGNLFCLNEDGVTFVVKPGDTFEIVGTNTLGEDEMGMSTPAIAGDRLLIRTEARVYSIKNGAGAE